MNSTAVLLMILLGGWCFLRPKWTIPVIVLLTCTLFNLGQYVTVALPVGYVEPLEAMLFAGLTGSFIRRRDHLMVMSVLAKASRFRLAFGALIAYCFWITACIVFNLGENSGTSGFTLSIRFFLAGVIPWLSFGLIGKEGNETQWIFDILNWMTRTTAVLHLAIQGLDLRQVMSSAYWVLPSSGEYADVLQWNQAQLYSAEFVRALPQGFPLMIMFASHSTVNQVVGNRLGRSNAIWTAILWLAIASTFTRSAMLLLFLACVAIPLYSAYFRVFTVEIAVRLVMILGFVVGGTVGVDLVKPGFLDIWLERFLLTFERDASIFSEESGNRGLDNLASLDAIANRPVLGSGVPRYSLAESRRQDSATDVHPLLQLALVGGVPAVALFCAFGLTLNLSILRLLTKSTRHLRRAGMALAIPIFTMQFAVNFMGVGGTIMGPVIPVISVFVMLCAANLIGLGEALEKANFSNPISIPAA
jgi:hypothetical protein